MIEIQSIHVKLPLLLYKLETLTEFLAIESIYVV